jgi:epoxyqueuosine reductase
MEKVWAQQSGLGWIGKHSNLITRELGSWIFLAEILTSLELEEDQESRNYCGTCQRCIDICPTQAIVAPYMVDARRCISYLTIELRGPIPRELRLCLGTRIFGCDDCQDVCPWNRFAEPSPQADFFPSQENQVPILLDLIAMTVEQFQQRFLHSPVRRTGYGRFLRNVAVALGNTGDEKAVQALEKALTHSEPLVRGHAAWALGQISAGGARAALLKALREEEDTLVGEEIRLALQALVKAQ